MNQNKLLVKATKSLASLSEFNPQLLRELKGRLTRINLLITVCLSGLIQLGIIINRLGELPDLDDSRMQYSRYCFSEGKYYQHQDLCSTNLLGHWDINWQLFWLDTFVLLTVVVIIGLLVGGVYLLITDLVKETERGTLSFIQFSPQSANTILIGKILGVPILLYLAVLLAFPLHLVAALKAGISLSFILAFDVTILASCWLFYSLALLFSLLKTKFVGLKPWLGSGLLAVFLWINTGTLFHVNYHGSHHYAKSTIDWIFMFNPMIVLTYLIDHSNLASLFYGNPSFMEGYVREVSFYGQHLWQQSSIGIGFILVNYYIWQHWIWKGLKRCFDHPNSTSFSKIQTYCITGCFVFYALGFTLQTTSTSRLYDNYVDLQWFLLIFFLVLMALVNPRYQTLQDWTRYRHQFRKSQRILWKDLILGEKSPAIVAIALNLAIATVYIIPSLLIFTEDSQRIIWGLILGVSSLLLYSVIAQCILLTKHPQRATWSLITVSALVIVPPVFILMAGIAHDSSSALLITFAPTFVVQNVSFSAIMTTLLGQWLIISLTLFQITRQLGQLGKTETRLIG